MWKWKKDINDKAKELEKEYIRKLLELLDICSDWNMTSKNEYEHKIKETKLHYYDSEINIISPININITNRRHRKKIKRALERIKSFYRAKTLQFMIDHLDGNYSYSIIIIRHHDDQPFNTLSWRDENCQGKHVEAFDDSYNIEYIYWFELESDLVAFKLKWVS